MNDSLRRAMFAARLTDEDVAVHLEVDPKTVRRWLGGRLPYARHRQTLANLLQVDESILWPYLRRARQLDSEVIAVYPRGLEPTEWFSFFDSATNEVDVLHQQSQLGPEPDLAHIVDHMPPNVRARFIVTTPALVWPKLQPEHRLRQTDHQLPHDLYRADCEILMRQHTFGHQNTSGPIIHIADMDKPDGLFVTYSDAFEAAWRLAEPTHVR